MKKKKGFTLVEVLAVVIILGIVSAIIYPILNRTLEENRRKSFIQSLNSIARAAEIYKADNNNNPIGLIDYDDGIIDISYNENLRQGAITEQEIDGTSRIYLQSFYDGEYCASGYENNFTVTKGKCEPVVIEECFLFSNNTVTGYNTYFSLCGSDVNIPSKIEGQDVLAIGDDAFKSNQLTSVTIPNSVTSIGDEAFGSNQLTSVDIPDSVTSIGDEAFAYNNLTSVKIPNSVTSIGYRAFTYNIITSVTIPNSVTSIGTYAFSNNILTSVTIPVSITNISEGLFFSNKLTSVAIPDSVTSIGHEAFCDNKLTSVAIPDSVTSIGDFAFCDNKLTSVAIPDSVTSIGVWAFNNNQLLDSEAFIFARNEDGSIDNSILVSYGGSNRSNIVIPDSVASIGEFAFADNKITSVTIPDSVTSIGYSAFYGNQLTSVTIPVSVTSIDSYAFYSNPSLTTIHNLNTTTSFNWYDITGKGSSSSCTFIGAGTCGTITILAS